MCHSLAGAGRARSERTAFSGPRSPESTGRDSPAHHQPPALNAFENLPPAWALAGVTRAPSKADCVRSPLYREKHGA